MQRTDFPFLAFGLRPLQKPFLFFSFSATPGILVKPPPHAHARVLQALEEKREGGVGFYSTNLTLVGDTTRAAGDGGCFI